MASSLQQTSVVIVGGGLVGLSAAVLLAWHNVSVILLEKHSSQSLHPRAIGYTPRTMEIFDDVGIAEQIPQVDASFKLRRVKVESMTGKWHEEPMPWRAENKGDATAKKDSQTFTPFRGAALAQDRLGMSNTVLQSLTAISPADEGVEPILREKARSLGADIRMGARVTSFKQDKDNVVVSVTSHDGAQYQMVAPYMIAADGHRSDTRHALGITTTGRGHLSTVRSVLFRARLDGYMKGYQQFAIRQTGLEAFLTTYGDDRWVLMFTDDVDRTEEERCDAIRQAVGIADLEFEVITTGRWELKANIADTFQLGRVFIAGDAAHTLPPTRGGYGANTGIHDVHNLAWKLAAVLQGTCRPEILESYSSERRPVAWLRHQQTFARPDYAQYRQASDDHTEIYDDSAIELGQMYVSDIIFDDEVGNALDPLVRPPDQWQGHPGTRAPYKVLTTSNGEEVSSLSLFGRGWVLVTRDRRWVKEAADATAGSKLVIKCIVIDETSGYVDDGTFCSALGLESSGASLVRPDGHIAWRSKTWFENKLCQYVAALASE